MFDLAHESFAKHRDSFFLEEKRGVLIVSEALLENEREEIQKKKEFLHEQRLGVFETEKQRVLDDIRQKDLERHGALGIKRDLSGVMCMTCEDESEDGVFLFPICEEAHHYACLECLGSAVENNNLLVCPTCRGKGDRSGMDEYKKATGGNEEWEIRLGAPLIRYKRPDNFSLTHDLPNEAVLLTEKTTVTLSNIEISVKLFFVLLRKTKVTVGERFSITKHARNEDCIREHDMTRNKPFGFGRHGAVSNLALENIERLPSNSIGCSLKYFILRNTSLINILPKLRINEDSNIKLLKLSVNKKEHVAAILEKDQTVYIGRVKKIELTGYAVGILPKLGVNEDSVAESLSLDANREKHVAAIHEHGQTIFVGRVKRMWLREYAVRVITKKIRGDSEVEELNLSASKEEHVASVVAQDQTICVGRVKNMLLWGYAASILPNLGIHKDCVVEKLSLYASEEEHVAAVLAQDPTVCVGRVKNIWLGGYAVCVITKLSHEDGVAENLELSANKEEHVAAVLKQGQMFCIGIVKSIKLEDYAVCVITKMSHDDCEVESLSLDANRKEHVAAVLEQEKTFCVGRVKNVNLKGYAVSVIVKMKIKEDCGVGWLWLDASEEEHVAAVLKEDRTFCVGRVKSMNLSDYAVSVITKMRIKEGGIMENFVLDADEWHFPRILEEGDSTIELGRIRTGGFDVPRKIKRKLRYTLVDGEASWMGDGEERACRRINHL
ncbi:MAG: uncharacterized protein A8A55_1488 [Amphiamblys sp. WSBS2006]|nr:MAG: uncharacterized protein A8A55_1488 [Amphiamblys sp. WSBS2006]